MASLLRLSGWRWAPPNIADAYRAMRHHYRHHLYPPSLLPLAFGGRRSPDDFYRRLLVAVPIGTLPVFVPALRSTPLPVLWTTDYPTWTDGGTHLTLPHPASAAAHTFAAHLRCTPASPLRAHLPYFRATTCQWWFDSVVRSSTMTSTFYSFAARLHHQRAACTVSPYTRHTYLLLLHYPQTLAAPALRTPRTHTRSALRTHATYLHSAYLTTAAPCTRACCLLHTIHPCLPHPRSAPHLLHLPYPHHPHHPTATTCPPALPVPWTQCAMVTFRPVRSPPPHGKFTTASTITTGGRHTFLPAVHTCGALCAL